VLTSGRRKGRHLRCRGPAVSRSSAYRPSLDFLFFRASRRNRDARHAGSARPPSAHNPARRSATICRSKSSSSRRRRKQGVAAETANHGCTGLIEVQDTTIVKPAETMREQIGHAGATRAQSESKAKLMRIYVGENDNGMASLCMKRLSGLRAHDIAGVTVIAASWIWPNRRIQGCRARLSHDRPILLSIVDTEEKLKAFMPSWTDGATGFGRALDVDVIKYSTTEKSDRRQETRA